MENKVDLQCNKIFHLEDSMVMYGVYNLDTLEDLIDTVHKLHNRTTWNENYFQDRYTIGTITIHLLQVYNTMQLIHCCFLQ